MIVGPWPYRVGMLGVYAVLALAAGCASQGGAAPAPASRDRITASDETDASKRARVRLELAMAYFGRGQTTVALDEVKQAIVADPNLGEAFNLRGLIYATLGDEALAEQSFRRALQINAADTDTLHNFGWYLCQRKRYAEASAQFVQALATQPRDPSRTLLAQGICQALDNRLEDAERTLMRSFELDPMNPATAVNLSEVLYRRGDYERARFYVRRVNAQPDVLNAQTLWLAARIERRLGNTGGVQEYGTQLRSRFGDSREAAAFAKGQFDE
jgi:type IV pilus assembly protein PilF